MMSLTFGMSTQVRDSGPDGPLVFLFLKETICCDHSLESSL